MPEMLEAWAETVPHECEPDCRHPHVHVNDPCDAGDCREPLLTGEVCYSPTQMERSPLGRNPWVCWRHIRPSWGPARLTP